jgi:hypothetical protein
VSGLGASGSRACVPTRAAAVVNSALLPPLCTCTRTHGCRYVMGAGLAVSCLIVAAYQPRWSEAKAMPHAPSQASVAANKSASAKSVEQC